MKQQNQKVIKILACEVEISLTTMGSKLGEHRGMISSAEVSSTYLILPCQSFNKELTMIANSKGPNLVPWGNPPLLFFQEDVQFPTLTHCSRSVKNELIQRI
jgi:hypothetical protein